MDSEEFDATDFEQRLGGLKDTQDSIQAMSAWCLKHRTNHKKVVSSWLNVLKQVKVEHRLTLFHLANDVIQYSKRKNYEFVDSWGTTLQRATTMVRDEKVKHKIIRIFNIWEQRGIYNDEFLADLHGLLSINPTKKQQQVDSDDEQASILSTNIRNCVRLEKETDRNFKILSKTLLCDTENYHALKDRRHVEDVEREIEDHASKLETYIKSLNAEIKARTILIAVLEQTDAFYHNQRGEVKVVANAYRNFGNRIKSMKRKLDELITNLPSPIPSPDINAPSPEPDNDFDLPDYDKGGFDQRFIDKRANGFLSCMDTGKLPFDINDFKSESSKNDDVQPIQVIGSQTSKDATEFNIDDFFKSIMPDSGGGDSTYGSRVPQPVPPVQQYSTPSIYGRGIQQSQNTYANDYQNRYTPIPSSMSNSHYGHSSNVAPFRPHSSTPNHSIYNPSINNYMQPSPQQLSRPTLRYPAPNNNYNNHNVSMATTSPATVFDGNNMNDEYNPESWDATEIGWNANVDDNFDPSIETPVSPPHFDQEGVSTDTIQYIDHSEAILTSASDVDHRQLRLPNIPLVKDKGRTVDVDHRNLISLTGSPSLKTDKNMSIDQQHPVWKEDVDFRQNLNKSAADKFNSYDSDYRIPTTFNNPSYNAENSASSLEANNNKKVHILANECLNLPTNDADGGVFLTVASRTNEKPSNPFRLSTQNIPGLTPPRETNTPDVDEEDEDVQFVDKPAGKGYHEKSEKNQPINDNVETIDMEMSDDEFAELIDDENIDSLDSGETGHGIKKRPLLLSKKNSNNQQKQQHQQQNVQHEHSHQEFPQNDEIKSDKHPDNVTSQTSLTTGNMFQNQFRTPLFSSPPPHLNRPLINPQFSQNRFWHDNVNNSSGGSSRCSPLAVNNNQPSFPHPTWNTPPTNIRRMNGPHNQMNLQRGHMRPHLQPHLSPFNNKNNNNAPRFGQFFPPPNNSNIINLAMQQAANNRLFNPPHNVGNFKIQLNQMESKNHLQQDQDDRLQLSSNIFQNESAEENKDNQLSSMSDDNNENGENNSKSTDKNINEQNCENDNNENNELTEKHTTPTISDDNKDDSIENICDGISVELTNDNSKESEQITNKDSSLQITPRKLNPFSQPPRVSGNTTTNNDANLNNAEQSFISNQFNQIPDNFHSNVSRSGGIDDVVSDNNNMSNNRPMPLLLTPQGILQPPMIHASNVGPLLRSPLIMRGAGGGTGTSGVSPYFNRPNDANIGRGHGIGFGGRNRGGNNNGGGGNFGPMMRGMSPAMNRRAINTSNNNNRGRSNGNFRGNFRGNW